MKIFNIFSLFRRLAISVYLVLVLASCSSKPDLSDGSKASYAFFARQWLKNDGRVIDDAQDGASHSEGQGWAMIAAAYHRDYENFARIWHWTKTTLQRSDGLFSWRYLPNQTPQIPDPNNASDGDILIAWGLLMADQYWPEKQYAKAADKIISAIASKNITSFNDSVILLPASEGFRRGDDVVVNLSYYVFPAFKYFAKRQPDNKLWHQLYRDGLELLRQARFGEALLPSDWVLLRSDMGAMTPWHERPAKFGYEAVRIPLYLLLAGEENSRLYQPFLDLWSEYGLENLPSTIDVLSNERSAYSAGAGFQAIAALLLSAQGGHAWPPVMPQLNNKSRYYDTMLTILAYMAAEQLDDRRKNE